MESLVSLILFIGVASAAPSSTFPAQFTGIPQFTSLYRGNNQGMVRTDEDIIDLLRRLRAETADRVPTMEDLVIPGLIMDEAMMMGTHADETKGIDNITPGLIPQEEMEQESSDVTHEKIVAEQLDALPLSDPEALGVEHYLEPGSVVGSFSVTGRDPADPAHACDGDGICVAVENACGITTPEGLPFCLNPETLVASNPFLNSANEAFQEGVETLQSQLAGREPVEGKNPYLWVYRIYYHISHQATGIWMGHMQVYNAHYNWTLGIYYYLDPAGDLRLVYYSVTPTDGYVAQTAVWRNFKPNDWY